MPTADVQSRLQAVLGPSYALERELGGGGMSRVFVARDASLGRAVVVKLLPPELAGDVSVERFRREIAVAARLQHPHVVPLLTAGEADGLLYYTMPLVEGESLRARLARDGALPIDEATALLRDVAGAIAYAHAQGVVHRDLKPANVLLSGGHALVADFGIAKALATLGGAASGLTSVGVAIGTPAYMAPEQAIGDPSADHRVDLYALGVLAYEMLAGAPPFVAVSHHEILAQHLTAPPRPLGELRPDVPVGLAALVARLLAKRPDGRPATADEVTRALAAASLADAAQPAPGPVTAGPAPVSTAPRPRSARGRVVLAVGAALVLGVTALAAWPRVRLAPAAERTAARASERRVVVAPFTNATGDARLDALGLLAADVVTQRLVETGLVDVASPPSPLAWAGGAGRAGDAITLGRDLGARFAVSGRIYLVGDSLRIQPALIDVPSGELAQALAPAVGPVRAPDVALTALRERVLAGLAVVTDERLRSWARAAGAPPTYESYRAFVDGRAAWPDYRTALGHFERAVRLDSTYALAHIQVATVHRLLNRCDLTDSIGRRLLSSGRTLAAFDRAFLEGQLAACRLDAEGMHRSALEQRRLAPQSVNSAYSLYHALLALNRPADAVAALEPLDYDRAAAEIGPTLFSSLTITLHMLGRDARGLEVARAGRARYPDMERMWFGEMFSLVGLGRAAEVEGEIRRRAATATAADMNGVLVPLATDFMTHGDSARARSLLRMLDSALVAAPSAEHATADHRRARAFIAARLGEVERARRLTATLLDDPRWRVGAHGQLGALAVRGGDRAAAERELAFLASLATTPRLDALLWRVRIHALLGERARAVELLRTAIPYSPQLQISALLHARIDLDSLRGDPGFEAIEQPWR